MARLFTSGFELNTTTAAVEWGTVNTGTGGTMQTAVVRSGTYAWRVAAPTGSTNVRYSFAAANQTAAFYFRTYVRVAAAPTATVAIVNVADQISNQKISLRLNADRTLTLYNEEDSVAIGSNSAALTLNQWYCLELSVDTTTLGTTACDARIDGTSFASGTAALFAGIARFLLGSFSADTTLDIAFDDAAINDTAGTTQNSWPGEGKVIVLRPNAAGSVNTFATQTGGTAGAANNFTRINETTPNDATDYNGSATLNEEDMVNVTDAGLASGDTVTVVHVSGRHRNSTADTAAAIRYQIVKASGGTVSQSNAVVPNSTTWKTNTTAGTVAEMPPPITLYADPDGAAWTSTTIDSMQVGYKLTVAPATAGNRVDVSALWVTVDYQPTTITAITTSDSGTLSTSESASITATLPTSDSGILSTSEAATIAATTSTADSGTLSVTESASLTAEIPTTDSGTLAVAEASTLALPSTDSGALSATEAATIAAAVPTSDSGTLSIADAPTVAAAVPTSDSGVLSVSHATTIAVTLTTSDSGTLTVTESPTIAATLTTTDAGTLTGAEAATIAATLTTADSGILSVTESPSVDTGGATPIATSDSGVLSVSHATTIDVTLTTSDSGVLSAAESATIAATIATTDAGTLTTSETATLTATLTTTDSGVLSVTHTSSVNTGGVGDITATLTADRVLTATVAAGHVLTATLVADRALVARLEGT